MKTMHFVRKFAVLAASAAVLAGCAATTFVKPDGTTDEPVWPQWNKVTFDNGRGTFPNPESLRQVKAGMTKDQLYYLLGRPHYGEAWRPVEWNYLFYFHTPGQGTDNVTTCQYKVLFDKDMIARNFYWNPIDPQGTACPIEGKAAASGSAAHPWAQKPAQRSQTGSKASVEAGLAGCFWGKPEDKVL